MVSRKNLQPLTDLQQQFRDIIEPILAEITIDNEPLDTLDSARLQEVLLERDLDDILCLKDLYSEDLNLEDKTEEVYNILQEILNSNTKPSSVNKLIEQLIEDCVVYDLKVQKRKELTLDYQRAFNGLVTKEEVTNAKSEIEKTKEYEKVEQKSREASSNRRKVKKKQKNTAKIQRTVDALQDISNVISDANTELRSPDLKELMVKAVAFIEHAGKIQQKELNDESVVNKEKAKEKVQSLSVGAE
jgi:hypothetical protein